MTDVKHRHGGVDWSGLMPCPICQRDDRIAELECELKKARIPYVIEANDEWLRLFGVLWYSEAHHNKVLATMTDKRADLAAMLDQTLAASVPVLLEVTERLEGRNAKLETAIKQHQTDTEQSSGAEAEQAAIDARLWEVCR